MRPDYSQTIDRHERKVNFTALFKEYDHFKGFLPADREASILEIGCGEGYFLKYLLKNGYHNVSGIDIDSGAVERCRKNITPDADVCDALDFLEDTLDDEFDAIVMNNTIEHFTKEDLVRVLTLMRRKLRGGGVFIAKTGNIENPLNVGLFLRDFTHHIGFTKNSLRQVLIMCGFPRENIKVLDIMYTSDSRAKTVIKRLSFSFSSMILLFLAKCMSMRIDSTSKLIFCVATK